MFLRLVIALARDDTAGAVEEAEAAIAKVREVRAGDSLAIANPLAHYATALCLTGRVRDANEVADELMKVVSENVSMIGSSWPDVAVSLSRLGRGRDLLDSLSTAPATPWSKAATHYVLGEFAAAADDFAQLGSLRLEADARLRAAGALVAEGRRGEADAHLQRALAFYRSVGATRYIREGEALLSPAGEATAQPG